jgi:hypothetical protein
MLLYGNPHSPHGHYLKSKAYYSNTLIYLPSPQVHKAKDLL